jgi:hypothetical protein
LPVSKPTKYRQFQLMLQRLGRAMNTRGNDPIAVLRQARKYIDLWEDEWSKDDHPHARPERVTPAPHAYLQQVV